MYGLFDCRFNIHVNILRLRWIFAGPRADAAGQESQRAVLRGFEILAESKKRARKWS